MYIYVDARFRSYNNWLVLILKMIGNIKLKRITVKLVGLIAILTPTNLFAAMGTLGPSWALITLAILFYTLIIVTTIIELLIYRRYLRSLDDEKPLSKSYIRGAIWFNVFYFAFIILFTKILLSEGNKFGIGLLVLVPIEINLYLIYILKKPRSKNKEFTVLLGAFVLLFTPMLLSPDVTLILMVLSIPYIVFKLSSYINIIYRFYVKRPR